jgi:SAM-dependent methyltransferase
MDFADHRQRAVFFDVHSGLPREAPGSRASTGRALALAGVAARAGLRVLDVACGPGAQTLDLAILLPGADIVALDLHAPFLSALRERISAAGVHARVMAVRADMARLPVADASIDLVWCEGAAYIVGVGAALALWQRVLRPGGIAAFTEAVWLRADVPDVVRALWAEYPAMVDVPATRERIGAAGFDLLGDFLLPEAAWWDDYYGPMAVRIDALTRRYRHDSVASAVLDECRHEIDVFREHSDCYGYAFFVARNPGAALS